MIRHSRDSLFRSRLSEYVPMSKVSFLQRPLSVMRSSSIEKAQVACSIGLFQRLKSLYQSHSLVSLRVCSCLFFISAATRGLWSKVNTHALLYDSCFTLWLWGSIIKILCTLCRERLKTLIFLSFGAKWVQIGLLEYEILYISYSFPNNWYRETF